MLERKENVIHIWQHVTIMSFLDKLPAHECMRHGNYVPLLPEVSNFQGVNFFSPMILNTSVHTQTKWAMSWKPKWSPVYQNVWLADPNTKTNQSWRVLFINESHRVIQTLSGPLSGSNPEQEASFSVGTCFDLLVSSNQKLWRSCQRVKLLTQQFYIRLGTHVSRQKKRHQSHHKVTFALFALQSTCTFRCMLLFRSGFQTPQAQNLIIIQFLFMVSQ